MQMLGHVSIKDTFSEFSTIERIYVKKAERGARLYIKENKRK